MRNSIKKYALNIVWIVLFGGLAIYFTLRGDYNEVLGVLGNLSLFWLLIIILVSMIPYLLEGYILKMFVNLYNKAYTYKQGLVNALSGGFFCGITPFSSGGQFAQVYIFKKQGIEPTNSVGILLLYFIIYQVSMVGYTLVILLLKFNKFYTEFSSFVSLALVGFIVNSVVISALLAGAMSSRFQNFLTGTVLKIGHKCHLIKNYEVAKINLDHKLENFRTELNVMRRHKKIILKAFFLVLIRLTVQYSIPFLTMLALGEHLPITDYFDYLGICAFIFLITAFIPIPGASGGSEATYVLLYGFVMGSVLAPSSMLIWRFSTYYIIMIIGCLVFSLNREINRRAREDDFI